MFDTSVLRLLHGWQSIVYPLIILSPLVIIIHIQSNPLNCIRSVNTIFMQIPGLCK